MDSISNRLLADRTNSFAGSLGQTEQVAKEAQESSFSSMLQNTLGKLDIGRVTGDEEGAAQAAELENNLRNLAESTTDAEPSELEGLSKARSGKEEEPLREAFQNFVGQTFFSQMITSLRSTQEGSKYFNGGQAEKIFQGQLDQLLSEEITKASASQISDPMFRLFQLQRSQ
jgi:peptidoglycan hydrolase FlgJ